MKKILLAAGAILIPAIAIFAQDNRDHADQADPCIKSQFSTDFPDAKNIHFAHVKELTEVSFSQDKEKKIAYYRDGDQLVGTIRKDSFSDLPDNAQKEIQHQYPGYTIANVVKFDDNNSEVTDMILYGLSMDDADNYFVELKKDSKTIVVKVDLAGGVNYLTAMK